MMRTIYTIAKAEFRTLIFAPIAWITVVAFFVISGIQFVGPLAGSAAFQEVKMLNEPGWEGFMKQAPLTFHLLSGSIYKFFDYFYYFLPLITMGAINKEVNNGNIKLFYSSPLSTVEFVLGKFLGLFFFVLLLLTAILLLLVTGYFSIAHAELGWLLSMFLAFLLLSAAYLAIGLYISSITNYQIVAAIVTFIVFLFFTNIVGSLFADKDILRDIFFSLSLRESTPSMIGGLITSRDFLYFIAIIVLFICLTIFRIRTFIATQSTIVKYRNTIALIVAVIVVCYSTSRPGYVAYWDVTRDNRNTLDSATQQVLKELDGTPLQITLYTNLLGRAGQSGAHGVRNSYVRNVWEKVVRFYPNIQLKYEYYYDIKTGDSSYYKKFPNKDIHQIAEQMAVVYGVDFKRYKKPGEIEKLVDLSEEDGGLIMELKYKDHKAFLRTYDEISHSESNLSGTIRRLTRDSIPKLVFTTGHYERSPYKWGEREFGVHANVKLSPFALINLGVDIDTLNVGINDIPSNTAVLVVADPKSDMLLLEQERITNYLKEGGNALFYAEPGKQDKLNPILHSIGVKLEDGILIRPHKNVMSEEFHLAGMPITNYMAKEDHMQLYQQLGKYGVSAYFSSTATLSYNEVAGFKVESIVKDFDFKDATWLKKGRFVSDSATPVFTPSDGDVMKDEFIIGVRLTRKIGTKEQRIIVMGDADFMTPKFLNGFYIGNGFYSWLLYNDYPVYTKYIVPLDRYIAIDKKSADTIYIGFVYVIPGLLLLGSSVFLLRRKRR